MSDLVPRSRAVFVSYARKDKEWADAVCAALEEHGLICWIAPRDILPGTEWGAAIVGGLAACKMMVLIFSANANESPQVRREVERAISKGMPVLPFRIEDVSPEGAMEFALGNTHWLDGFVQPKEAQLKKLVETVRTLTHSPPRRPPSEDLPKVSEDWSIRQESALAPPPPRRRVTIGRLRLVVFASLFVASLAAIPQVREYFVARGIVDKPGPGSDKIEGATKNKPTPSPKVDDTLIPNSLGMKFALIPAGKFDMGSNNGDPDEKPVHPVEIKNPLYLATTEVTQGQYRAVMGTNPSFFKGSDDLPVENVSWLDAIRFCNALSIKEGLTEFYRIDGDKVSPDWKGPGYRLPTEAEWEYASRAGPGGVGAYGFGDDATQLGRYAWYDANSESKTHPVGMKGRNAWGLFDMHGNVREWCWDVKAAYEFDPIGPPDGSNRVIRGGSWFSAAENCRAAYRIRDSPTYSINDLGLRLARVPSGK